MTCSAVIVVIVAVGAGIIHSPSFSLPLLLPLLLPPLLFIYFFTFLRACAVCSTWSAFAACAWMSHARPRIQKKLHLRVICVRLLPSDRALCVRYAVCRHHRIQFIQSFTPSLSTACLLTQNSNITFFAGSNRFFNFFSLFSFPICSPSPLSFRSFCFFFLDNFLNVFLLSTATTEWRVVVMGGGMYVCDTCVRYVLSSDRARVFRLYIRAKNTQKMIRNKSIAQMASSDVDINNPLPEWHCRWRTEFPFHKEKEILSSRTFFCCCCAVDVVLYARIHRIAGDTRKKRTDKAKHTSGSHTQQ